MANNTQLNLGTGGDLLSTEDIGGGVKLERHKIVLGASGVDDGDVAPTNQLPVVEASLGAPIVGQTQATPAGTALPSQAVVRGVVLKSLRGNTDLVYVGLAGMMSSIVAGFELAPGETTPIIKVTNLNQLVVMCATGNPTICYLGH